MTRSFATSAAVPGELENLGIILEEFGDRTVGWARRLVVHKRLAYPVFGLQVLSGLSTDLGRQVVATARRFSDADALVADVLAEAGSQVGYREGRNNDSRFGRWYGANHQPWCASFVSWAFDAAGQPLPPIQGPKGFARVGLGFRWGLANKRLAAVPRPGDIFLISHGDSSGHTGIVTAVNPDGTISTLEGNTNPAGSPNGDGVYRRTRTIASINAGFLRVVGTIATDEQWRGGRDFERLGGGKRRRAKSKRKRRKPGKTGRG